MEAIRILYLNDDPYLVQTIPAALEKISDFSITATSDSFEALELLHREHFNLLIQDIVRSDLNGLQLYWVLKADPALRELPLLLTTAWKLGGVERIPGKAGELYHLRFRDEEHHYESPYLRILEDLGENDERRTLLVEGYLITPASPERFIVAIREALHTAGESG